MHVHVCYGCKYITLDRYWYEPSRSWFLFLDPARSKRVPSNSLEHIQVLKTCPCLAEPPYVTESSFLSVLGREKLESGVGGVASNLVGHLGESERTGRGVVEAINLV